jgi:flagellar protein FliO/FliZ
MSSVRVIELRNLAKPKNISIIAKVILFTFVLIAVLTHSAHAAEFDPVKSGIRMFVGLLVVLAIILGLYYLLRGRVSAFHQQDKGIIKVKEIRHVMPKKTLMIVEVRGREFLVGAGSDTISTIVPLQTGESFSSLLEQSEGDQPS